MPTQTTFANPSPPSSSATQSTQRVTPGSRATGQPLWLTPPTDRNQLYSFTLPVSVANTPHTRERGMAELDIRDVRLVQAIHGGLSNFNAINMPFLHLPFTTGDVHRTIGYTVPYPLKYKTPRIPFGRRRASTASFASWDIVTTLLTSVVIPCQLQLRTLYTRNFADVYTHIYIVNYDLKFLMMFKHTTTCFTNWVLSAAFPAHSYAIFFGWLSSSMSHSAPKPNATSP